MTSANSETNCYECVHRRSIAGDCHTQCAKPDPEMTGSEHGIKNGWFMYPFNFDPIWKTKVCSTFEKIKGKDENS